MKKFICAFTLLFALTTAGLHAQTIENELSDYDFAVNELEMNYAGFPRKTAGTKLKVYKSKKDSLRSAVIDGRRKGYDAVAELFAWFEDFHLRCDGRLTKKYMKRKHEPYAKECEYSPQSMTARVDDDTFIRLPSCNGNPSVDWIKNSISEYLASGCENLILDIRGNGGGWEAFAMDYIDLLYDKPGILPDVYIRNGQSNREYMKYFKKKKHAMGREYRRMKKYPDSLFIRIKHRRPNVLKKVSPLPKKAAIIIDGNVASMAECLLMDLRTCSGRTRIYGRDNTLGCIDNGNLRYDQLPFSKVIFTIPITRTYYFTDRNINIDDTGIAPDVRINLPLPKKLTDNIDEWVRWVAEDMK